jgi:putative addiction module component (TIGR02574 family)
MSAMPLEEIRSLPVEERLRIVEDIWESIRTDADVLPLTSAQRDELERRLAAHRADPNAGDDLASVLARIRAGE